MAKAVKRIRVKSRIDAKRITAAETGRRPSGNRAPVGTQVYNASQYLKRDLMWSGVAGGTIVVFLIVLYVFLS